MNFGAGNWSISLASTNETLHVPRLLQYDRPS
jgi:hypothetical protein